MSRKYKFGEKSGAYFISFANLNRIDVFTRDACFWCIIESLDFCRKNKGMELYGYCITPSHVHLIFRSTLNALFQSPQPKEVNTNYLLLKNRIKIRNIQIM